MMNNIKNEVLAELKKQKNSLFLFLSIFIPISFSIFLSFYFNLRADTFNSHLAYLMFFQAITLSTPLIISIFCGMLITQERNAGGFKNLLGLKARKETQLFSKVIFIILSYAVSLTLATFLYMLLITFWVGYEVSTFSYLLNIANFIICVIFQCFLYSILSYKLGGGMTSVFGLAGLMITALSFTSLGDRVWYYLPWAWQHRVSLFIYDKYSESGNLSMYTDTKEFFVGAVSVIFISTAMILIFKFWGKRWEGNLD